MSRVHGDVSSSFKDTDGSLVEYFKGDQVKDEHAELLDSWGALVPVGEEHLTESERAERALNPDVITAQETASSEPSPAGGTSDRIAGDYSGHTAPDLQAEIEARRGEGREIDVDGTGAGGNVLKDDLVGALEADDAAGGDSP